MTTEQMHVIAKITDARTFERQLEQTVEEAAEFIQAAQKIKRYPGNSLQMNHLVEETGDLLITLEQIRIYLVRDGYGDALNSMIDYKLNRELGRMEQERKDNESKYADAASMTFIGTNCAESEEIHMTVAAVALKPDITAIAVCEDGSSIRYEGDLETKDQLSIEKLINAVGQLEDLRCDREGFAADFEDEEDNAFCLDVVAIDTALAAIKRLIELEYEKE